MRLIPGGLPTEALVADVLVSKYADHLPLYRQAQILAREGVHLNRSTLAHWVGFAAYELGPLHARLVEILKASRKLFADETRCPVLDPGLLGANRSFEVRSSSLARYLAGNLSADIVVLDNLGSHRSRAVRTAILDVGAKLAFLPPPVRPPQPHRAGLREGEAMVRMAQARTVGAIHERIARLVASISRSECESYLKNAGYDSSQT